MKKTVLAFCTSFLAVVAGAQSTCETRVDAHPKATTNERVSYCLTSTSDAIANNPGLVFSGVTVRHPSADQPQERPTARAGKFDADAVGVNQSFVATQHFPKLTNNRVSEQEIWAQKRAVYQGQQLGQDAAKQANCEPQAEPATPRVQETKKGLLARHQKPSRRMKAVVTAQLEEPAPYMVEPAAEEVSAPASEYNYDTADAQPYTPATQDAQEYVPAEPTAQPYAPYTPAEQAEIPVGTSPYAPAN